MHRYFVTGTDTDVGKTRVSAALALALRRAGHPPTVAKLVQTGLAAGVEGDAARAGRLAQVPFRELARFRKPADPWSAAHAEGVAPVRARELVEALAGISGALVSEGAGGLMVPLNPQEHLGDVAARSGLRVVVVVGLRLGCLNHALLTHHACERLGLHVAGAVLVERWGATDLEYRADATRVLQGKMEILGILPFAADEHDAVSAAADALAAFVRE